MKTDCLILAGKLLWNGRLQRTTGPQTKKRPE